MQFFDAHAHVQLSQFDADREAVLVRMEELYMGALVIGVDLATSQQAVALAERYDFLYAAVGLHPNDNLEEKFDKAAFAELAQHTKVVAIGECGLDFFRSGGTEDEKATQKERFEQQIDLALKTNKPLIIHCRNAHDDMLEILAKHKQEHNDLQVVMHFFTGTGELAQKYLDFGFYLSFPGPITYTDMYDESIRVAPMGKILAETDSPFAAPVPYRGKRNEPAYVVEVVKKIAAVKGILTEEVAAQTLKNAQKLFRLAAQ